MINKYSLETFVIHRQALRKYKSVIIIDQATNSFTQKKLYPVKSHILKKITLPEKKKKADFGID